MTAATAMVFLAPAILFPVKVIREAVQSPLHSIREHLVIIEQKDTRHSLNGGVKEQVTPCAQYTDDKLLDQSLKKTRTDCRKN